MWVDYDGSNSTSDQIVEILSRAAGTSYTTADLCNTFPVGAIYENGLLWFQRIS